MQWREANGRRQRQNNQIPRPCATPPPPARPLFVTRGIRELFIRYFTPALSWGTAGVVHCDATPRTARTSAQDPGTAPPSIGRAQCDPSPNRAPTPPHEPEPPQFRWALRPQAVPPDPMPYGRPGSANVPRFAGRRLRGPEGKPLSHGATGAMGEVRRMGTASQSVPFFPIFPEALLEERPPIQQRKAQGVCPSAAEASPPSPAGPWAADRQRSTPQPRTPSVPRRTSCR